MAISNPSKHKSDRKQEVNCLYWPSGYALDIDLAATVLGMGRFVWLEKKRALSHYLPGNMLSVFTHILLVNTKSEPTKCN